MEGGKEPRGFGGSPTWLGAREAPEAPHRRPGAVIFLAVAAGIRGAIQACSGLALLFPLLATPGGPLVVPTGSSLVIAAFLGSIALFLLAALSFVGAAKVWDEQRAGRDLLVASFGIDLAFSLVILISVGGAAILGAAVVDAVLIGLAVSVARHFVR